MNNAQIKSAPCPERLCVRTACYGLASIVNDNTWVAEHKPLRLSGRVDSAKNCDDQAVLNVADRRQRRPSEKQNNSLKNEGCAIGRKAGNFADDETTGVNGCLLVAIGISADQPKKKPRNKRGCGAGQNFTSAGLWCFSQSFRAASIRVCQPLPVALNASTTSGEQRMVMRVFVVLATGRPRFLISSRGASTTLSPSRSMVSGSDFAAAVMAASSSGVGNFVPGRNLSFDMAFDLPAIGLSEADNAPFVVGAVSKHNTINPVVKVSESDVTLFPVVSPGVHHRDAGIPLKGSSVSKRDTVLLLVYCVFGCIKSYVHTFIVCTINKMSKGDFLPGDAKEKGAAGGHALWLIASVDQVSGVSGFAFRRWSSRRAISTSARTSSLALLPISSMRVNASREESRALSILPSALRLAISPRIAVTMKLAVDSCSSLTASISSITSWGTLAASCADFLFTFPVDIEFTLKNKVCSIVTQKCLSCIAPVCNMLITCFIGEYHLLQYHRKDKAPQVLEHLAGLLTTSDR